ncbi:hypothetical protein BD324DRAFT_638524 [Kockovaella imperatae]|uniref:PPP4R2-domain-containing protein n=1 Tax=Kockovaella imperatae TaxID=4999 RepID=A0A1Y1U6V1_9TREE|nr:hypothetical protein BD324DRAFT_638524 [Kockovaella imperatae]ORX33773.1 hypothetical protein BD324DRAFT_638524 [Kockovaella imperatae]
MAISPAAVAGPSRPVDPILQTIVETNTFECDWETLKDHLTSSLISTVPLFLSQRPRKAYVHPGGTNLRPVDIRAASPSPARESSRLDTAPPSDSLLLSPDHPTTDLDPPLPSFGSSTEINGLNGGTGSGSSGGVGEGGAEDDPASSPNGMGLSSSYDSIEFKPSTVGGLIIPPFPPLDPNRKRSEGSLPPLGSVGTAGTIKANGHANRFEEDWDEEVVIGGKKLPEWMDEVEGKEEVERLINILDEMEDPPFTIQRIAELLVSPTRIHTSLGKFLRAIEKSLLVTSSWEPPSYIPMPMSLIAPTEPVFSAASSSASPARSTISLDDEESMMPRGSATPMFSPITFFREESTDGDMEVDLSEPMTGQPGEDHQAVRAEDGLMSPLLLGDESPKPNDGPASGENVDGGFKFAPAPQVRSPTPEPEQSRGGGGSSANPNALSLSGSISLETGESSDPGNQPYLGRVDELDTGPMVSAPELEGETARGAGEAGNMVQHGMSDRPVPLSSTTVVKDEERKIAPKPKTLEERFTSGSGVEEENGENKAGEAEAKDD